MDTTLYDIGAVGAVVGWVNIVRKFLPTTWERYLPLVAISCGVLYSLQVRPLGAAGGIWTALLTGLTVGLSAAGTFSGAKSLAGA